MVISELIGLLQAALATEGDIPVALISSSGSSYTDRVTLDIEEPEPYVWDSDNPPSRKVRVVLING